MTVIMNKRDKDMEVEDSLMIKNLSYELFHFQTNFYSTTGHVSIVFILQMKTNILRTPYVNTTTSVYIAAASRHGLGNKHKKNTRW